MSCTIHTFAEKRDVTSGKWDHVEGRTLFQTQDYSVFAFLAGVRNTDRIRPFSLARRLPTNGVSTFVVDRFTAGYLDSHHESWLAVSELTNFDYTQCATYTESLGSKTYVDALGPKFFADLAELAASGAERIVFWFKN